MPQPASKDTYRINLRRFSKRLTSDLDPEFKFIEMRSHLVSKLTWVSKPPAQPARLRQYPIKLLQLRGKNFLNWMSAFLLLLILLLACAVLPTQFDAHTTTQFAAQSSLYFTCRFHIWLQAEIHRNNRLVGNKYIYIFDTLTCFRLWNKF